MPTCSPLATSGTRLQDLDALLEGRLARAAADADPVAVVQVAGELAAHRVATVDVDDVDAEGLRTAAARAVREHPGARAVAWALDPSLPVDEVDQIQALVEGAMLGGYDAGRWKSCGPPRGVDRFIVWGAREELREAAREPRSSHGGRTSHESSSTPRRTWPPPLLERFAGEEPWAPVDMIGPALLDDDRGDAVGRGASGYGVSMLIELASRLSDPQAERS